MPNSGGSGTGRSVRSVGRGAGALENPSVSQTPRSTSSGGYPSTCSTTVSTGASSSHQGGSKKILPPTTPRPSAMKHSGRSRSAGENRSGGISDSIGANVAGDDQHARVPSLRDNRPPPMSSPPARRPPRAGLHRSCRSDGAMSAMAGILNSGSSISGSGGSHLPPTARNLALDFFPEATGEGNLRPRKFFDGSASNAVEAGKPFHPSHGQDNNIDGNDDDDDDCASSGVASFYSRGHDGGSIEAVDNASSIGSHSSYSRSHSNGQFSHEKDYGEEEDGDVSERSYGSEEDPDNEAHQHDGDTRSRNEKVALIHQSILSAPHSLDEEQLNDIFRSDGHHDARIEIPMATEIYGSSASLAHRTQNNWDSRKQEPKQKPQTQEQEKHQFLMSQYRMESPHHSDLGPPPLIESPDSDTSSRKRSPPRTTAKECSPRKDKDETTLSDASQDLSGYAIPRTIFYTPQATPDAKRNHSTSTGPHAQNDYTSSRPLQETDSSRTPLSLKSIHSANIDFLCYGDPEEVPDDDDDDEYSATSARDSSVKLDFVAGQANRSSRHATAGVFNASAPSVMASPSPTMHPKKPATSDDSPQTSAGSMYTVEDIVRASASAISRVLNLTLSEQVDENMDEITRQTYDILQSQK